MRLPDIIIVSEERDAVPQEILGRYTPLDGVMMCQVYNPEYTFTFDTGTSRWLIGRSYGEGLYDAYFTSNTSEIDSDYTPITPLGSGTITIEAFNIFYPLVEDGDPLTRLYNAVWSVLESDSEFRSIFKSGNRIKFTGSDRSPLKDTGITADFPEIRVASLSSEPHPLRTSNGSSLKKRLAIQVLTGDQRLDASLYAIEWLIYRILAKSVPTFLTLRWNSREFVKNIKLVSINDTLASSDALRPEIAGWTSLWVLDFELWFNTGDL